MPKYPVLSFCYQIELYLPGNALYEKGARSPKEKYLNALADIFEVSPHALLSLIHI